MLQMKILVDCCSCVLKIGSWQDAWAFHMLLLLLLVVVLLLLLLLTTACSPAAATASILR
jgi:hypothetical protein